LNSNPCGFAAAEAEAIVAQANLDGIAQGGNRNNLDVFPFEEAHFEQALDEGIVTLERLDATALADAQLIQGGHERRILGRGRRVGSGGDRGGTHNNLRRAVTAEAQAAAADFQKARAAGLEDLQYRAGPDAQLGQPAHPARLANDLDNLRRVAGAKVVERQ
jgi:hypothetical protein